MSQPAKIDLKTIYKDADWSIILTFPYVITALNFEAKIIVDGVNDVTITTTKLTEYQLQLSLTDTDIADLDITNYTYYIKQLGFKQFIAVGQVTIAEVK